MPQFTVSVNVPLTTRIVAKDQREAELIANSRSPEEWAVSDRDAFEKTRQVVLTSIHDEPDEGTPCICFEYSPDYWEHSDYDRVEKLLTYVPLLTVQHFHSYEVAFTYYTGYAANNIISWIDEDQAVYTPSGEMIREKGEKQEEGT